MRRTILYRDNCWRSWIKSIYSHTRKYNFSSLVL